MSYCALGLSSDVALPELDPGGCEYLKVVTAVVDAPLVDRVLHRWTDGSEDVLAVAKVDDQYVIDFGSGRSFSFDVATRSVGCPADIDATGRHQLLDQVLPRVLNHLGHLMIHASAVDTPNGAVLFVGSTGAGKSSLAASFGAAGFDLVTDDCVRLVIADDGTVGCVPTYPSLRLWPDSAEAVANRAPYELMSAGGDKRRIQLSRAATQESSAVAAICVLADENSEIEEVRLAPIPPSRAVSLLLGQAFRLDPTDAAATRRIFSQCADIAERVPVFELEHPRVYERLPEVRAAVLDCVGNGEGSSATPE